MNKINYNKIQILYIFSNYSILGHRIPDVPVPLFSVYPASKFALTALSQTIRQELSYHKTNIKLTVYYFLAIFLAILK